MKREKCESGNVNCEIFQFFGFCCYLLDSLKVVVVAFELILGLIFLVVRTRIEIVFFSLYSCCCLDHVCVCVAKIKLTTMN